MIDFFLLILTDFVVDINFGKVFMNGECPSILGCGYWETDLGAGLQPLRSLSADGL